MSDFIQQTIDSYMAAQQHSVMLSVIIAVAAGLLICFFGYKLLRLWCAIIGFAAGAVIAGIIAYAMGADVVLLVACVVGIITALLSFAFYRAGVFVIGFGAAINVIGNFMTAYNVNTQWWMIVLTIAAAAIVGALALRFVKTVVVISTALSGAVSVVVNILGIFNVTNWIVIFSLTAILAVLGMAYQFTHSRKKRREDKENYMQPIAEDTEDMDDTENTEDTEVSVSEPEQTSEYLTDNEYENTEDSNDIKAIADEGTSVDTAENKEELPQ